MLKLDFKEKGIKMDLNKTATQEKSSTTTCAI